MQSIETKFDYDGFTFWLIMRQRDLALFAKTKPTHSKWSYEIVVLQRHEAKTFASGRSYPDREALPTSEQWGECAWTPFSMERALPLFEEKALERRWSDCAKYKHVDFEAFTVKDSHSMSLPAMEIPSRLTCIEQPTRLPEKGEAKNCTEASLLPE